MIKEKSFELSLRENAEEILLQNNDNGVELLTQDAKNIIHELRVHQIELQMQNDELKLIHNKLKKSKQRYLDLYNKAPVGYLELNNNLIIQEVNTTALKLFGLEHNEIINDPITKFIFKDDQDTFYFFRRKLQILNEQHSCVLRMLKSDGSTFWGLLEVCLDKDDILNNVFRLVIHNISSRKKIEEQLKIKDELLIAQSRQAAMGEMLSMIAHQWRQPLTTIGMISNNLKVDVELGAEISSNDLGNYCEDIQYHVSYLSQTINDFKNFLNNESKKENISICDVMDISIGMIKKSLENNNIKIEVDYNCINNLELVKNELNQVFINIINNAKDSLIESKIEDPVISIKFHEDENFINIEISDNGNGIPANILPKLGEPYVSSKSKNGMGLGVYMAKLIIEKHMNGILKWENLNEGARFQIILKK